MPDSIPLEEERGETEECLLEDTADSKNQDALTVDSTPTLFLTSQKNLFLSAHSTLLTLLYLIWISDDKMLKRSLCLIEENQNQGVESQFNNPSQGLKVLALNIKIPGVPEFETLTNETVIFINLSSVFFILLLMCMHTHAYTHAHDSQTS